MAGDCVADTVGGKRVMAHGEALGDLDVGAARLRLWGGKLGLALVAVFEWVVERVVDVEWVVEELIQYGGSRSRCSWHE
jgi:hypothetical protein